MEGGQKRIEGTKKILLKQGMDEKEKSRCAQGNKGMR